MNGNLIIGILLHTKMNLINNEMIMTQEEKELLIKDLCSRLPYNCMVSIAEGGIDGIKWADVTLNTYLLYQIMEEDALEYVKPYLRPMSSMTEEEENQFQDVNLYELPYMVEGLDWLNAHHFDYRGLIPMGLALEAKDGMYNN